MMRHRVPNYARHLTEWASSVVGQEIVWGETDCHALVRQAATIMYGEDIFADVPRWHSRREAWHRLMRGEDIVETLLRHGAERRPHPVAVTTGDIVVEPGQRHTVLRPTWVVVGSLLLGSEQALTGRVVFLRISNLYPDGTVSLRLPGV